MTTRKYSSRSQQTTLSSALTSVASTAVVVSGASLLGGATISSGETYTVVIDPDTALEEIVDVTARSTNTLTITRNIDGSSAQAHSAGAIIRHMAIGRDYTEANNHIESTTGVHGVTGAVVGRTDTQTLTNKTLTNPTINAATLTGAVASSAVITGGTVNATTLQQGGSSVVVVGAADSITTGMIINGTILNADINASAAIDKTKISGTAVTLSDTGTVTSTMILDGTILNADINSAAAIALSKLATDPLARANHTGTQTASTVSDFDTQVRTSRLDQMAVPTASVAMNSQKITGLATPTSNTDAATKAYTDGLITNLVNSAPSTLDTLNELATALGNDANYATTTAASIATKLPLAGGTMSGAIAMGASKITGLGTPTATGDAATKDYADLKLALTGGTMSGAIVMGTNKITGLGTPTSSADASTKAYADTMLPLVGGTMSGAIAMGGSKITGLGTPTNTTDAVTKAYADAALIGAPGNLIGPITSVGAATAIASQTGTGTKFVMDTSPTLVTPALGVATATSINGTIISTGVTLLDTGSTAYIVPSQTGNNAKYLTTDGTTSSWGTVTSYSAPTLGSTSIGSGATVTTINGLTKIAAAAHVSLDANGYEQDTNLMHIMDAW